MSILNALGFFIDYCERNANRKNVKKGFQEGTKEILSSPEGRFSACQSADDVLRELGWEPI